MLVARENPEARLALVPDEEAELGLGQSTGMADAIILARRLRELNGRPLDHDDFRAIGEATGIDAAHLAQIQSVELTGGRRSFAAGVIGQYRALDSELRKYVAAGVWATATALFWQVGRLADGLTGAMMNSRYGVFQQIALLFVLAGIANAALARTSRAGIGAGAIFGGASFLLGSLFAPLLALHLDIAPTGLLAALAIGALVGGAAQALASRGFGKRITDPESRRRDLLLQMAEIQTQLVEGRDFVAFLSVDIVGSTRMKTGVNPLDVELTLVEYHRFVETVARKYGGQVHSTAGDGATLCFDDPARAFLAAKNLQLGIAEFNAHRNKIGVPIGLRCGLHADRANLPQKGERTSLQFSSVIDIAAHLQGEAPPGGIAVSEPAAALIPGGADAIGSERVLVSGMPGVVWTPRRAVRVGGVA